MAYATAAVEGDVMTGRLVRLACERHIRDLEHGLERGLRWDQSKADHALSFFRFLRLAEGVWAGREWRNARGERTASISLRAEPGLLALSYRSRRGGGDWQDVELPIPLTWMPCYFGGRRPWFLCPRETNGIRCCRRVAKLYSGFYLLCRHCYDLVYECQLETLQDRLIPKARKIRLRLRGTPSLIEPFPSKPRGTHWRTYLRLRSEADIAESATFSLLRQWCDKVEAKWL